MIVPKGLSGTPLATCKKIQMPPWGCHLSRAPRCGQKGTRWVFLWSKRSWNIPNSAHQHFQSPSWSGSSNAQERHPTSCPNSYLMGHERRIRFPFLWFQVSKVLETKISFTGEMHFPTTFWVMVMEKEGSQGRAGGHSKGQTLFIPHLLLRGSSEKYANGVFLHFPCISPSKLRNTT